MIKPLEELVESLAHLPTIGKKSAWRLAVHILEGSDERAKELADRIISLKEKTVLCERCFNYSVDLLCPICSSTMRNKLLLCVVEKPLDVLTIEKSGRYHGLYHVLGGVLSPINGVTTSSLRINELKQRIDIENPNEIILGLGGSAEAETTSIYLTRLLDKQGLKITRFARGLPAGLELEYVDQLTLYQALNERTVINYSLGETCE